MQGQDQGPQDYRKAASTILGNCPDLLGIKEVSEMKGFFVFSFFLKALGKLAARRPEVQHS
jgi:hypothetical protein